MVRKDNVIIVGMSTAIPKIPATPAPPPSAPAMPLAHSDTFLLFGH